MTLTETQELWEVLNPNGDFWDGVILPENLDKETLVDFITLEYGDMRVIDDNTTKFHKRIATFFKTHKWNIEKLAKTLEFKYNPIEDTRWFEKYHFQDDRTTDFTSNRDVVENEETDFTENVSTGRTDNIDKTINEKDVINKKEILDDDWTEDDTIDNTKVNYVSAFNMAVSPSGNTLNDSEHHRDTEEGTIGKIGTDDKTTTTDTTDTKDTTYKEKEIYTNEDDTVSNEQMNNIKDDDLVTKEILDDDIYKRTKHFGNDRHSFQSLIEEERKQAQFNIYKWIARHFSLELLICIW